MRVSDYRIKYRDGDKFRLIPFGDVHWGSTLCSKRNFRDMIAKHKDDPNTYWIDMGDGLDLIIPQGMREGKRWKASQVDERYAVSDTPVDDAIRDYAKELSPIKDRLIAILDSNHHETILKSCGTDPTKRICEELWGKDDPRVDGYRHSYSGFLRLHFDMATPNGVRVRTMVIFMCHGISAGGKTEGGSMTAIGNNAKYYRAAVHLYGHNHQLRTWDVQYIAVPRFGPRIKSDREIRVNTGTFQKQFEDGHSTSYGERFQFKPSELGYPVLEFSPSKHGVECRYWKKVYL